MRKKKIVSRRRTLGDRRARPLNFEPLESRIVLAVAAGDSQLVAFQNTSIISSDNLLVSVIADDHQLGELFGKPAGQLYEGQTIRLDGVFQTIDSQDERTVEIDWGDGSPATVQIIQAGKLGFSAEHVFADDSLSSVGSDPFIVNVIAADSSGGDEESSVQLTVSNAAPLFDTANVSAANLIEGDTLTFSATFDDPGADDHTVEIDWGDGVVETVALSSGGRDIEVDHIYTDDAAVSDKSVVALLKDDDGGVAARAFTVSVANAAPVASISASTEGVEGTTISLESEVSDPGDDVFAYYWEVFRDDQLLATGSESNWSYTPEDQGSYVFRLDVTDDEDDTSIAESWTVEVANSAPSIDADDFAVYDKDGNEVTEVSEGDVVYLNALFADLGIHDTHLVTVDWGDGTSDALTLPTNTRNISGLSHRFADDALAARDIVLTVSDETHEDSIVGSVAVANVPPSAMIRDAGSSPSTVRLTSDVFDPGINDTFSYAWTVIGNGVPSGLTTTNSAIEFDAPVDGFVEVSITVTDDDGGDDIVSSLYVGASPNASDIK